MTERMARKERPAILAPAKLDHLPPDPLRHLAAVAEVTRRSQQIALAALHEALTQPVCPARVEQLRRVTDDMNREVRRLEDAIRETYSPLRPGRSAENPQGLTVEHFEGPGMGDFDAEIVRVDDPPVRTAKTQNQLDELARLARMASGAFGVDVSETSTLTLLRDRVNVLADELAQELPCTGEDAGELGEELFRDGDIKGIRTLRDLLVAEAEDPKANGPALDVLLYGTGGAVRRAIHKEYYPKA